MSCITLGCTWVELFGSRLLPSLFWWMFACPLGKNVCSVVWDWNTLSVSISINSSCLMVVCKILGNFSLLVLQLAGERMLTISSFNYRLVSPWRSVLNSWSSWSCQYSYFRWFILSDAFLFIVVLLNQITQFLDYYLAWYTIRIPMLFKVSNSSIWLGDIFLFILPISVT